MRKIIAGLAIAVCVSLCAVSLAQAGSRTAEPGAPTARAEAQDRLTIHRLLRDRIEFTIRLARAMRFVEPPVPVDEPIDNTYGIIDEPDPAGNRYNRDEDDDERERQRRRREHETMSTESSGGSTIEMTFRN